MKLNISDWTYNGNKLKPPHVILWGVFWFIPFTLALAIACFCAALIYGRDAAIELWEAI